MKVLELVLKWCGGGVERYVEDLVVAGNAVGIDCQVASVTTAVTSESICGEGPLVAGGVRGVLANGDIVASCIADGKYDIVHIHGNNGLAFYFAHLAVKGGAKAIVHSHNSSFGSRFRYAKSVFTGIERRLYAKDCSGMLACSRTAGAFLFAGIDYQVAFNGIDAKRFAYNEALRYGVRSELGVPESATVIGFAASIIDAKNPMFALEVFELFLEENPNSYFLVCGDGDLSGEFMMRASSLIDDGHCLCVGRVADIERYYCAMDALIAPSKYEGLPINLIEAQASGLPIVMSDAITDEVIIVRELCERLSLVADKELWVSAVEHLTHGMRLRSFEYVNVIRNAGYAQPDCFDSVFDLYQKVIDR